MKKILFLFFFCLLIPQILLFAEGQKEEEMGWMRTALVTEMGNVNDQAFNELAYEGMMRAAEEYELQAEFIEIQHETEYEMSIRTFAEEGYDIIISLGYKNKNITLDVASQFPDITFIGVDQIFTGPLPNTFGLIFAEDQSGFIAGALAAMMSKSGIIGIVSGPEIPAFIKYRRGYENGAKYIKHDIKVLAVHIDSLTAPDRGKAAAEVQISEGADVIFGAGGITGSGGIIAAMEKGVWAIGSDQDEYYTTMGGGPAPYLLSSVLKRVDNVIYNAIKDYLEGTFESGYYTGNASNEGIGYAPFHDTEDKVSQQLKDKLEEIFNKLGDGSLETGVNL